MPALQNRPLQGRRILVTRPREQAAGLASLVAAAGGEPVLFPAIEIEDVAECPALGRLQEYDLAIFVSPTAVQRVVRRLGGWPAALAAAAVGPGTRRALEACGVRGVLAPHTGADSEALLARLEGVQGKRILILRGERGRQVLGETLAARGARVEYAQCYRRVRPRADAAQLPGLHAVTVSSAEGLDNLLVMLDERSRGLPWFVPHPRVADHAVSRGLREVRVGGTSDEEMLACLVAYFANP